MIDGLGFEPWRYFTLDVVGDPGATMRNYELLLKRGYKPVPIFTRGSDVADVDRYFATSDMIGVGGLVGTTKSRAFVNGIMPIVARRKVHLLGFTRFDFLKHHRPYSVDSSNFNRGQRYGWLDVYLGNGQMPYFTRQTFKPNQMTPAIARRIAHYGFDPYALAKPEGWSGAGCVASTVPYYSWVDFSIDAEKAIGTRVFLACAPGDIPKFLTAYERIVQ